jgi:hypothetical protein
MNTRSKESVSIDELTKEILSQRLNESCDKIELTTTAEPKTYIIYADGKIYYSFGGSLSKARLMALVILLTGVAGLPEIAELIRQITTT